MKRRTLLTGAGALALAQGLSACGGQTADAPRIRLLQNSLPSLLLRQFRAEPGVPSNLVIDDAAQLADLFRQLQQWQQVPAAPRESGLGGWFGGGGVSPRADLVTLGDYWLTAAIQQQLIQPLPATELAGWESVPVPWQQITQRHTDGQLDPQGAFWGAPYRWGSLMMVYRQRPFRELDWQPRQWSDLWRPELQGHIALPDHPRLVLGLALKRLTDRFTVEDLDQVTDLSTTLAALHQQVRVYTSDAYLQPLAIDQLWLAVGWSTDILPALARHRQLAAVAPTEGTVLTTDLWVRPAEPGANGTNGDAIAALSPLMQQWIEFYWQLPVATALSTSTAGAAPQFAEMPEADRPNALQGNLPQLLPPDLINRSEFLPPLPAAVEADYLDRWRNLRTHTQPSSGFGVFPQAKLPM